MSYSDGPYGRDPRDLGESQYPPPPGEYPPPPGEEDERARIYARPPPQMQQNVSLPPISPYEQQYAPPPPNGYPPDPRAYRPEQYQPGPPLQHYDQRYPPDYGRQAPPQVQLQYGQSAPRQRTAIACRYCRRRKIRCSGFEDNPTGKCQNCTRFQQECIFTPVSSQAQAFVPAHAAYPHLRNVGPDGRARMQYPQGQQLYGAHGQPLGPMPSQPMPPYGEYPIQPPAGPYGYVDDRGDASRKRPHGEPQTSLLPPPLPGQPPYTSQQGPPRRQPADEDLRLPPVTPTMTTPSAASSVAYSQSSYTTAVSTPVAPPSNYSPVSNGSGSKGRLAAENVPGMSRTSPARMSPTDRADPMALGNIVATSSRPNDDIDRSMLGRLGRK